ncbi:bsr1962 [Bradyrhizobium diazoefficiens USDA 110]|uniref:Bsr1962 protein n=1 Tax=Bradyrhizobium diazoefficiens (strain JCM 10833 / BCRC 13528 / IAM 13628 / NBRC 14792 / USDA 110) TaxID=224911 RepID=Q89TI5_BRADU|nr:bsr1962 [Bradyrhizobium diazoefficiens USDA 110]
MRLVTKPVGKPDAGKPHVRFDERGEETERATSASPRLSSTLLKRGKTDAADAEAISEAVARNTMRFVPVRRTLQSRPLS